MIIEDVDLTLRALGIVYRVNGSAVEGLYDRNVHRQKVVGGSEIVSWVVASTICKGRELKLTKNMLFHSGMLKLCLNKKHNITEFFPDTTVFNYYKTRVSG